MKNTHEVKDIEGLINDKLEILKNGETKKEKVEARRAIIKLEKFYNDITGKKINGKKYPDRMYHSGPEPMNVKELYKLIDSVEDTEPFLIENWNIPTLDLSGVFISDDRTTEFARTSILDLYKPTS